MGGVATKRKTGPKRPRPGAGAPPPEVAVRPRRPARRRAGTVAIIGRPNVGKSTLLNSALGQPLAIVSPTPQTTRDELLGILHYEDAEIAFLDTPGLHRPRTELGRVMNHAAREAARAADVVVFVTDVAPPRVSAAGREVSLSPHPSNLTLLEDIGKDAKAILVINKVDRVKNKGLLLPLIEAFSKARAFEEVMPISATKPDAVERVVARVAALLPEGAWRFGPDDLTDRPTRFFAGEYIREQILLATKAEVPHAAAVTIDQFVEPATGGVVRIDATIHVERSGQKKILVGTAASMLKRIGTQARMRIEELIGRQVHLKLWVRVTPEWRQSRRELEELGLMRAAAGARGGRT